MATKTKKANKDKPIGTPKKILLRDAKGHFSKTKTIAVPPKDAKAINKVIRQIIKQIPPKPPKPIPIEEHMALLDREIAAIKAGMNQVIKSHSDTALSHTLKISEIKGGIEKHRANLEAFFADPNLPEPPNAYEDRKALDWAYKLRAKFMTSSAFPFPPTPEETMAQATQEARRWTRKLVGINATWIAYGACAVISLAKFGVAILVIPFGALIACIITAAIWKE